MLYRQGSEFGLIELLSLGLFAPTTDYCLFAQPAILPPNIRVRV